MLEYMIKVYWFCLVSGVMFALIGILFDDLLANLIDGLFDFFSPDDLLDPLVLRSALTLFGAAGITLTHYTAFSAGLVMILAILCTVFGSVLVYFIYIKPMENAENSVSVSINDLVGKPGEVTVLVAKGYCGEVMVRTGVGTIIRMAITEDEAQYVVGTKVQIIGVTDGVLLVTVIN